MAVSCIVLLVLSSSRKSVCMGRLRRRCDPSTCYLFKRSTVKICHERPRRHIYVVPWPLQRECEASQRVCAILVALHREALERLGIRVANERLWVVAYEPD